MKDVNTVRMTSAQAVLEYIQAQYVEVDGHVARFVDSLWGIFGHGNVAGLGQAMQEPTCDLRYLQGHNEQSMVHAAVAYAREHRRRKAMAVTASIGPGATNLITGAALATINRLPVLLLPGDSYANRRQGTVLQQLEVPGLSDVSVNDCLRPVSRFFDRINRPEQLIASLPEALRVLTDPAMTGAVTIALPQDVQSEAADFPKALFEPRTWAMDRQPPTAEALQRVSQLILASRRPLVIAGGGVWYSDAHEELERFSASLGIPVAETFAGKGALQRASWRSVGGVGVEGTDVANQLARDADLVIAVGTRLGDFVTGSQSIFQNPEVAFVCINIDSRDANKMGAVPLVADARTALASLTSHPSLADLRPDSERQAAIKVAGQRWRQRIGAAVRPESSTPLTGGGVIGTLNSLMSDGDVLVAAAGAPPGELQKAWDATGGKRCHIEFGFSCMGYELPGGVGARLARPDGQVVVLVGDGSFLLNPGELVTMAQERLNVIIVILENRGYQIIRRLQTNKTGTSFGNEFRTRDGDELKPSGGYIQLDLVATATGLGATAFHATSREEFTTAYHQAAAIAGPAVIVAVVEPQEWLPATGTFWDVAPAAVSTAPETQLLRETYETEKVQHQRFYRHTSVPR